MLLLDPTRWFDLPSPPISLPFISVPIQPIGRPNQGDNIWEEGEISRHHRTTHLQLT